MKHDDSSPPLFSEHMRQQLLHRRVLVLDGVLDDDNGTLLASQLLLLAAEEVVRIRAEIEEILSSHTGQGMQTLRQDTDRDRVFTAAQALDYGLVDQVLTPRRRADAAA